jgi:hypothetical protein
MSRSPIELELLLLSGAIPEIKIDQVLIRDATLLRKTLEVLDRIGIEPNRDLAFRLAQIRVRFGLGEVIALSHGSHLE